MRQGCDDAGLPTCLAHGLGKAICRRLAEAGATAPEILSVSGHTTLAAVQRCIKAFRRKGMAGSAVAKLPNGRNPQRTLTNHPARFAKWSGNTMKGN